MLSDLDPKRDIVLMMEVRDEGTYVPHYKQKIVLILSAMRHFAEEIRSRGIAVDYVKLDDPANTGSFTGEVKRAVARHRPGRIVVTEPGEWRVQTAVEGWSAALGVPVEIREDTRFFSSRMAGHTRTGAGGARRLRRARAAVVRRLSGRDEGGRAISLSLAVRAAT